MIINQDFYNLNTTRSYPVDEIATGVANDGQQIPNTILSDMCFRFPVTLGQYAFLSALHVSTRLVSLLISVSDDIYGTNTLPVAALTLPRQQVVENIPCKLVPLVTGVAGWVVFSNLDNVNYAGKFNAPSQSLLAPRSARSYHKLPIDYVSKDTQDLKLVGDVTLLGDASLSIISDYRIIQGVLRKSLVFSLKNTTKDVMTKLAGPCGGRPESGTCNGVGIEQINDVKPDADGNITLNFELGTVTDIETVNIPHGIMVNAAAALPEICGKTATDASNLYTPQDFCASELLIISESHHMVSQSISDINLVSQSLNCFNITWPIAVTFPSNATPVEPRHPAPSIPFLCFPARWVGWPWATTSDYGYTSVNTVGGGSSGALLFKVDGGPSAAPAYGGFWGVDGFAIYDDECRVYEAGMTMRISTMFATNIANPLVGVPGNAMMLGGAGIVFGAGNPPQDNSTSFLVVKLLQNNTLAQTIVNNGLPAPQYIPKKLQLARYDPNNVSTANTLGDSGDLVFDMSGVPGFIYPTLPTGYNQQNYAPNSTHYILSVTIEPSTMSGNPNLVSVSSDLRAYYAIGGGTPVMIGHTTFDMHDIAGVANSAGRFGIYAQGLPTQFMGFKVEKL